MMMPPATFEALITGHANAFMVGGTMEGHTVVNAPAPFLLVPGMQKHEAANLAAWLIIVADLDTPDLNAVFRGNNWPQLAERRQAGRPNKGDAVEVHAGACFAHVTMGAPEWQLRRVAGTTAEGFRIEGEPDHKIVLWEQHGALWRWP